MILNPEDNFTVQRHVMVTTQIERRGLYNKRILEAMRAVPRHEFVPADMFDRAYADQPLPIGNGQTISQPYIVALMSSLLNLKGDENVLEIGTGSGYQAAILGLLSSQVVSIERIPKLAASARNALDQFGITNVVVFLGDGTRGRADMAPYDRIVVTAGGPDVPQALLDQLAPDGMLVGPFGPRRAQKLTRYRRSARDGGFTGEILGECDFVDLIGQNGWRG